MSQKTIIWLIVVILVVVGVWIMTRDQGIDPLINNDDDLLVNTTPTPTAVVKKTTPKTTEVKLSYSETVAQFKDRRIQFNAQCQATPGQITVKKGEKMMLDNRSSDSKTLTIGGQKYELAGYAWSIVTATTTKALPYGLGIDCRSSNGSVVNSGIINLQAGIGDAL